MKVLATFVLAIGTAAALGSGPYLPSGWRPDGPAFYLPSEPQKIEDPTNIILQESEGSSSDFLREYGPPKVQEVSQDIKIQNLPEVVTEQPFVILDTKFGQETVAALETVTEVDAELKSEVEEVTDAAVVEEAATTEAVKEEIEGKSLNLDIEASVAEEDESEVIAGVSIVEGESSISAKIEAAEEEEKVVEEGVKNIAEAIVNLEKEVIAEQVQISQDIKELKTVEITSGAVEQVPEGFLEYGPPGFREYGPPNQNSILRSDAEETGEAEKVENNQTRRRRFSPKFRSTKKH